MAGAALLFAFSAVVFLFVLLQAPAAPGFSDLLVSGLDRFLDGRSLMELATRRNMILLCHAILLLILRDAGVLGAPASRRSRSTPGEAEATAAVVVVAQTAAPVPVPVPAPARPHATRSTVVWRRRRPRNRPVVAPVHVHEHDAADRVVEYRPPAEAAATWAAPLLTTGPAAAQPEEAGAVATKQIVVVESPKNDHDRATVAEPLGHPTTIAADDGETGDCDDRRIIAAAAAADDDDDTAREQQTPGMETEMEMELADDRTFEEFIESQRRQMRQESLRLVRSAYHYQAVATCY